MGYFGADSHNERGLRTKPHGTPSMLERYLVEIRLKTALKLLQLREKSTADAELRS